MPRSVAHEPRNVDVALGRDLAGDDHEPGRDERLAGHAAGRILGEDRVEHGVRDLVGHLVGMALGDGFGGERKCARFRHGREDYRPALVDFEEPFERHRAVVGLVAPEEERLERLQVVRGVDEGDVRIQPSSDPAGGPAIPRPVALMRPAALARFTYTTAAASSETPASLRPSAYAGSSARLEPLLSAESPASEFDATSLPSVVARYSDGIPGVQEDLGVHALDARVLEPDRGLLAHEAHETAGLGDEVLDQRHRLVLVLHLGGEDDDGRERDVRRVRRGRVHRDAGLAVEEPGDVAVDRKPERELDLRERLRRRRVVGRGALDDLADRVADARGRDERERALAEEPVELGAALVADRDDRARDVAADADAALLGSRGERERGARGVFVAAEALRERRLRPAELRLIYIL